MSTRRIPPLISTEALAAMLGKPGLVILDIRSEEEYSEAHIPGSINIPFKVPVSKWVVIRDGLLLELPPDEELFETIGSAGIDSESEVVVVGKTDTTFNLADAARVAVTLIYAGIKNVAILDGGFNKWVAENRETTKAVPRPSPRPYRGVTDKSIFVTKQQVLEKIGKAIIIDARDPDVYFGVRIEPFINDVRGHIKTAKNLPAIWVWTQGTYKPLKELEEMVLGVIGPDKEKEIILYCGAGGYAAVWWFILREMLGYVNTRIYDGSWQEWVKEPSGPITVFTWE